MKSDNDEILNINMYYHIKDRVIINKSNLRLYL
jgi:hypothetical protein